MKHKINQKTERLAATLQGEYLALYQQLCENVTSAMVNNYVKLKLIPKPNKKKYNKEHIAYLYIYYFLCH